MSNNTIHTASSPVISQAVTIQSIADSLIHTLSQAGFTIQRYDASTTDSIYLLKATGNWTEEDELIAFDPSKPPPRPLAELEAEHDAFMKELFKNAKPL